jgi:hypothetical protein
MCNCGQYGLYPDDASAWKSIFDEWQARPNMNADDIVANDAHRDALLLSTTAFTRWGVAYPADAVADPAAVLELRI